MTPAEPAFTIGVEEEYLLVDAASGALAAEPPDALLRDCRARLGAQVTPEFLRAQLEIGTRVCAGVAELRRELTRLRHSIADIAGRYGLAPVAASTHPFADWHGLDHTHRRRYEDLAHDMQAVARRLLICGMHVHVGIDDEEMRIDLLNQARYFLPHLLCLTTSSPFWQGGDTGLKCYRLTVFDSLPRTGLPEPLASWSEYQRLIESMRASGLIQDGTKIWWDLRPSARFPTLELRIADVCTDLEDALTVAALFQCILRMLYRLRMSNRRWRDYPNMAVHENRWLAQRYGSEAKLVDFGKGTLVPLADLVEELIAMVAEDADRLGCREEVERARHIVARGTSADRQLRCYAEAGGAERHDDAMRAVVAMLRERTVATGTEAGRR